MIVYGLKIGMNRCTVRMVSTIVMSFAKNSAAQIFV
jgi:hypothetical protein